VKPALALLACTLTAAWAQAPKAARPVKRALPAAWAQAPKTARPVKPAAIATPGLSGTRAARIPPQELIALEQAFNNRLLALGGNSDPSDLLRDSMGLQLDDYGVVFTAEVSLVRTPTITPFRQTISPQLAARVHQQRVERMPLLKAAMVEMMRNMAQLAEVPPQQQLVLLVKLYYGSWEDTTGMKSQLTIKSDRAAVLAGKIEVEEQ
jgi:hypothetical protein